MKLLVATDFSPDAPGGGPAVVRQMLRGFPGEIHWWSVRDWAKGLGTRVEGFEVSSFRCCPPGKLMPAKKLPRLRAFFMEHLWAPRAVLSLRKSIQRVKPDCIWVIPHDWSIYPLWRVMGSRGAGVEGRELRVHVTIQDYPDAHFHGKLWGEARTQRMARMQETLYVQATTCDATSLPMLADLEIRTGRGGIQMLHQGLETKDFAYLDSRLTNSQPSTLDPQPSTTIKIAYAGTILCEPEFALFIDVLASLTQQRTKNQEPRTKSIELHLYGAHSYADRPWFRSWIIEHGNFSDQELLAELRKYDWGFIPMSLEDADPRYNHFSFPTKFITYLAAGLPIITIGHQESSVMKMASAYKVGITIQSQTPSLEDLAKDLFSPYSKQFYLPEILRCSRKQFDAEAMRGKLWKAFGGVLSS